MNGLSVKKAINVIGMEGGPRRELGVHLFIATVTDPKWEGMVDGELIVAEAVGMLVMERDHKVDGAPKAVTVLRSPELETGPCYRRSIDQPEETLEEWSREPSTAAGVYDV